MEVRMEKRDYITGGTGFSIVRRTTDAVPLHAHDYYELEFILSGHGTHRLNGTEHPLTRGCLYLLTPSDYHAVSPDGPVELWNFSFDETLIDRAHLPLGNTGRPILRQLSEEELTKLDLAARLLQAEDPATGCFRPLIEYIMSLVLRENGNPQPLTPIQKAILYIQAHFRENPTLAQTAAQCCLSPVYFGSLFRQTTGMTYIQYLNQKKVNCGKMLLESGMSVTEACYGAGFGSLSGFLHTFRQFTGMSPQDYRNSIRR